ncbi:MAG TPA: class I SAM-dependent methyltransferase [Candidatus Acidoferrales bacterium]|nr:class I SAM-dependent methyltransferase [Candidatus Acidoferrales bacterium]
MRLSTLRGKDVRDSGAKDAAGAVNMPAENFVERERERIRIEYQRRSREVDAEIYAPWNFAVNLNLSGRQRLASTMLHRAGAFPQPGDPCLEVGFGTIGWLAQLIAWGMFERDLHGIDLDEERVRRARAALPIADLRRGDASELPWPSNHFRLVIQSTVFSSVLDRRVRRMISDEITRVLRPGGALLWYDLATNNPRNPHVRGVRAREIRELFPSLKGPIKSLTLAPPISRALTAKSWLLATLLESVALLHTHRLAVLVKDPV